MTHKLCEALSITANVGLVQNYVLVDHKSSGSEEDNDTGDRGEGSITEGHGGATQIRVGKLEHPTPIPPDRDLASTRRSTPPSPRTGATPVAGTAPSEQNRVPPTSSGTPPSPSHHKNEISAAFVRAGIGRDGDQPNPSQPTSSVAKKQLSYTVSNELQLPTIQALAVLSNVSGYTLLTKYPRYHLLVGNGRKIFQGQTAPCQGTHIHSASTACNYFHANLAND